MNTEEVNFINSFSGGVMNMPALTQRVKELLDGQAPWEHETDYTIVEAASMPCRHENVRLRDPIDWLARQLAVDFRSQVGGREYAPNGDIRIIKDINSAKPFILYQCTSALEIGAKEREALKIEFARYMDAYRDKLEISDIYRKDGAFLSAANRLDEAATALRSAARTEALILGLPT